MRDFVGIRQSLTPFISFIVFVGIPQTPPPLMHLMIDYALFTGRQI